VNTAIATLTSGVTAQKAASATLIKDQKDLILKKAGTTKSDVDAQLASVAAARADVARAKAELAKTIIAAPFSGVITKMDVKIGEVASPNATSITIQSADIFHAVTYVPEVNVASVAVGNDASITLDAYGTDTLFPAKVIAIDPAETLKEGIATYKTTLIFNDADARIKSGMTANVKIATKERPQVIVIPQGAVHVVDGQSFVTKSVRGTFSEVLVTIGSTSSLGQVEVFSGLEEGDVIAFSASGE
jgi:RND family efflux transporter MFP subunit